MNWPEGITKQKFSFKRRMKVLVTGASGFLGRNLVDFLESKGHETIKVYGRNKIENGVQLDLLDFEKVETLLDETKPDFVVHAAACCNVAEVNKARVARFSDFPSLRIVMY